MMDICLESFRPFIDKVLFTKLMELWGLIIEVKIA